MWNGTLTSLEFKACTICVWFGIGHSCYGQLTAVRKGYPLTSVTWLYLWGNVFKVIRWPVFGFKLIGVQVHFLRWYSVCFLLAARFKLLKNVPREPCTGCPKSSFLPVVSLYFSTIGLSKEIISTKVVSFNIIHYFHTCCAIFCVEYSICVLPRQSCACASIFSRHIFFVFRSPNCSNSFLVFCEYHER